MEASDRKELRVILDNINVLNDEWFDTFPTDEGQTGIHDALEYEIIKADKILAKRPRNCDIGTAEEQYARYEGFCDKRYSKSACSRGLDPCDNCELCEAVNSGGYGKCVIAWEQMPYKKEGGAK